MIAGKLYGDTTADDRHQEPFQSVEAAICQDGLADRMSLMGLGRVKTILQAVPAQV